jgi:hypothetical protein
VSGLQHLLFLGLIAALPANDIEIIADLRPDTPAEVRRDLGRPFKATSCSATKPGQTILEALGQDAIRIRIHRYDNEWRDERVVKDYLQRVLNAVPEGGMLFSGVYWSEGRQPEIIASAEFSHGERRKMEFANGYAHVEDQRGCEWWGRYFGGDQSKWVVRP